MAILTRISDSKTFHVPADALLGRGEDHDVPLQEKRASAPHARLRWTGDGWQLCDLASLNGTYVNDFRMPSGERTLVNEGDRLRFGSKTERFEFGHAGPPSPLARCIETGTTRPLLGEVLLLPDDEQPRVCIYLDKTGVVMLDVGERQSKAVDREVVQVAGQRWQIRTLMAARSATVHNAQALSVDTITAHFVPSPNHEHVKVALTGDDQHIELKPRAFHYLLLVLAQARRDDETCAEADRGWVDRDELCRMLNSRVELLNVDIYRARRQFGVLGILGAPNVVERRSTSRELRLGIRNIVIASSG